MDQRINNHFKGGNIEGDYVGGNQTKNYYISMFQDLEREFVVTHNADIKPVSYFTGRETELQELRQRLEEGRKSVLVSGMGGIGKTHICRKLFEEYTKKHADGEDIPFCHIGYVEYNGDMGSSLQTCLKFKEQDDSGQNQEAAWRELEYLAAGGKLLLFVDNVDKPVNADPGLQRLKGIPGAVILTSRQASFSDEFEPYPIGFLDMEQCKEIYEKIRFKGSKRKVRLEEEQDLKYVIEDLAGRHTITVELLAHLARTKTWTVKRLREELGQKGFCLAFHKNGKLVNIQKSYEVLYDLSKLTEAEQNILEAFSIFPYISLEAEICNQWLLADAGVSEEDDILMGLYQKGWLQFDIEQGSYAMHPVFAKFIYERCKPKLEGHRGLIEGCQKCLEIPESGSVMECQHFIPFAENILKKISMENEIEHVQFMDILAYSLQHTREYAKAEVLYEKILQIRKKLYGQKHPDTATGYNNLAAAYAEQEKDKEAKKLYKKALLIREKVLGEEHPDTADSYNNLAGVYSKQGKCWKAEGLHKRALLIREKVLGEEHPDTADSYNNLAVIYAEQEKYRKAERFCKRALLIREKVLGGEHLETANSYNNLARIYAGQEKYKEAEELHKKALSVRERVLGEDYPDIAYSYDSLAEINEIREKYKEAEELYRKSLQIRMKVLGEEYPDTVMSYLNLASVLSEQGKYGKAEELYKKGIQIGESVMGKEHSYTAIGYNNLAGVYIEQGKIDRAIIYYHKAYQVFVNKFGRDDPDTQVVYGNLEAIYRAYNPEGNFEQWLEEKMKEADLD